MIRAAVLCACFALAACQSTAGGGCPPLVGYPPALQSRAAKELRALPKGAAIGVLVADYGKMRDACRATEGR